MADQWYYSEQGQRRGPVPEGELKQRAASGQLKPTDKVWKKGMASWAAASEIEGLIPEPVVGDPPPLPWDCAAPSANEPPSEGADDALSFLESSSRKSPSNAVPVGAATTPPRAQDWATKARKAISDFAQRGKAVAQLVAKQTERTKLVNVTLPAAHQALGRHIHKEGCFRDEFPEVYKKIDGLFAQIAALQTQTANAAKVEGLSAKAKAVAKATSDMAQTQAVKLKLNHALTELGKAVFEKHGEQSAPAEVVGPIVNCRARIKKLDDEIIALSKSQAGQWLTPKRLAIGGLAGFVVAIIFAVVLLHRGDPSQGTSGPSQGKSGMRATAAQGTQAVARIASTQLSALYLSDEPAADAMYGGKIIEVVGSWELGGVTQEGWQYVALHSLDGAEVDCVFSGPQGKADFDKCNERMQKDSDAPLIIRGKCLGFQVLGRASVIELAECEDAS